jgi:hypothetical protein
MPHPDRLRIDRIALAGGAIAVTVALVVVAVLAWLHARGLPPGGTQLHRDYALTVDAPPLQSAPQLDLQAYRAEKARRLHETAWVDASQGIARIPIDDAMALMLQQAASAPEGRR